MSAKSQSPTSQNSQSPSDNSEIQVLKTQLKEVKNQLNNLTDEPQKNQLEDKITALENKVKNLINPDKSTIQQLEQEIKEIKEKLENNDKPDRNPPPTDKTEIKLRYVGEADSEEMAFNNFFGKQSREDLRLFYISRNHPQIKELINQDKLQVDKVFIARYGKVDHISPHNLMYIFNENNQELEIREA
ncbi:19524_t:CDS:1 [Racocetra persica]|uniref:19524_t:CDS:1 n=1 Tax=Racocetra persica TaxID=160502 RepID=A0ACA9RJQ4_9GLOM|nr:19524_t:CDS:1 [Racocetra persica]